MTSSLPGSFASALPSTGTPGQLRLGDTDEHRAIGTFLCDAFKVRINLGHLQANGWPTVYEVGGRCIDIAEQNQCAKIDLHLFEDGACCLGLKFRHRQESYPSAFVLELVIPFFYRLSYTDRYGLAAAKDDLWGEYSHGDAGCTQVTRRDSPTCRQQTRQKPTLPLWEWSKIQEMPLGRSRSG